ncbi:amidohydrolase family protein [Georgenia yuyongxinii]|uniref:amidohydrolase family protein n=1 Tax=Georgenia yuyongxinii TaxID=2589797 RepID=UPI001C8F5B64|nr:amidohydrolase family protein [Georgenia yuyongxinii]
MSLLGSVDVHTHLAPVLEAEVVGVVADGGRLAVDGHTVGPAGLYAPGDLETYLDDAGLDSAVVSAPPPFFRQHLPADQAAAWGHALNDGMLRAVAGHTRLLPLAYLPLEHPDVAAAQYAAVRDDVRWAGVVASAGGRSHALDDEALAPLWRMLDADGRTLLLHPGAAPDARLTRYYLANLLGNPAETGVATAELVFGGVLSTYPRVRVILSHCGGVVPAVVGRWQHGYDTDRPGVARLELPPREAVRRLYVDTLAHDPAVVDLAAEVFGSDRLLLGSDWPFPMGSTDPLALLAHRGGDAQRLAAVDNAAAALGRLAAQTA